MWVIFRELSGEEARPVSVYDTCEKALYYAEVLRKKTKSVYHVRRYAHNEGTWL